MENQSIAVVFSGAQKVRFSAKVLEIRKQSQESTLSIEFTWIRGHNEDDEHGLTYAKNVKLIILAD